MRRGGVRAHDPRSREQADSTLTVPMLACVPVLLLEIESNLALVGANSDTRPCMYQHHSDNRSVIWIRTRVFWLLLTQWLIIKHLYKIFM